MAEFVMPKLGADMEFGTLVAWRKQPGDAIRRGEIIAEVETAKGVIEAEAFASGMIEKLLTQPGQKVPIGTVMAIIRDNGAAVAPPTPPAVQPSLTRERVTIPAAPAPTVLDVSRIRISPAARRLAQELCVDPASVKGTGRGGAIMSEDIERAAAANGAKRATPPTADKATLMRQAIAAAMARSNREIPHYYLSTTIDMHRAMIWLEKENASRPMASRLLYGALLIKAVALALREVPELNAVWQQDHVDVNSTIHVGVAISLRQGGLVAPAVHNTDQLTLDDLMKNLLDLVSRARSGRLRGSEMSDPTITVTSLGEQGVEAVLGVIYPPQVALVGFGKIVERPWSVDGQIVSRRVMTATLSADHRVSDGHRGAIFLAAVDRLLQEPEKL